MQGDMKISGIIEAARATAENASLKPLDPNADLREAAEQFEAIFLNEFMKQARKAKLAEDILGSDAQDTYLDMMDRELSTHCLLYTSPSPRDVEETRMPSSA